MLRLFTAFVALIAGLAFHSRNHQPVPLDFYIARIDLPLSWVVVAALAVGAALGMLAMVPGLLRGRIRARPTPATPVVTRTPVSPTPHGDGR